VSRPLVRSFFACAALLHLAGLAASCTQEPVELTPYPEIIVVLDTNAHVPQLFDTLQIDLYLPAAEADGAPVWFFSREFPRPLPDTWPVSFAIARDELDEKVDVLVRARLYPAGKLRDNRGEAFFEDATLATYPGSDDTELQECPTFNLADKSTDGLLRRLDAEREPVPPEQGVKPLTTPQPNLAIDRLARLRFVPGVQGTATITLRAECTGIQADLLGLASCIDGSTKREPLEVEALGDAIVEPPPGSDLLGTFPPPAPCTAPLRSARPGLFEEEVCVDGGAFQLGDPLAFGFNDFDGFPERIAILPPRRVDRYEVTVGRFRALQESGALAGVALPVVNDGPLADSDAALDPSPEARLRHCTFSTGPLDASREDYPLNCVTFETARAFCQADGGDLPTEAQWEYVAAAAGRENQDSYAWGPEPPTCDRAVFGRGGIETDNGAECLNDGRGYGAQPEGAPTQDLTLAYQVSHMAGNLREWTLDSYRAYCSACWALAPLSDPRCEADSALHTVRGGSWSRGSDALLSGLRDKGFSEGESDIDIGFRCMRDAEPGTSGGTSP